MCNGRRDEGLPSAVGGIFNVGSSAGMARTQVSQTAGDFLGLFRKRRPPDSSDRHATNRPVSQVLSCRVLSGLGDTK
jgi:hypothetical protein